MAFANVENVEAWALLNGGEAGVRQAIAAGILGDPRSIALAEEWIRRKETERNDATQAVALQTAIDSAKSAKSSAMWAMWAAIAALATALLMLAQGIGWLKS